MSIRATEKIMEALSQLLEGFAELQDNLDSDVDDEVEVEEEEDSDDDDDASSPERIVLKHLKSAIEAVIETDDFAPEEIANLIAALTEALEEVDPNIFSEGTSDDDEDEEEDEDDEDLDDDDDLDFDDDDLDEDDEEVEEGEDEDEDEEEAPRPKGRKK